MVTSHREILKSSSIVGGAQAITYVIGLLRTKAVALLLGPSGVGLVGLYVSAIRLVGTFAQFGINESGVREVAAAAGTNNAERIAATSKTQRRVCWASGITIGFDESQEKMGLEWQLVGEPLCIEQSIHEPAETFRAHRRVMAPGLSD